MMGMEQIRKRVTKVTTSISRIIKISLSKLSYPYYTKALLGKQAKAKQQRKRPE